MKRISIILLTLLTFALAACSPTEPIAQSQISPTELVPTSTSIPATHTSTPAPSDTPTPTPEPTWTSTPEPTAIVLENIGLPTEIQLIMNGRGTTDTDRALRDMFSTGEVVMEEGRPVFKLSEEY